MTEPILRVKDLVCKLQIQNEACVAVDRISFSLYPGKTLAIVGESGCGKTLTALSLLRILPQPPALPPEGEVIFHGQNILQVPEREMRKIRGSRIAMIFQSPASALNPVYTIGNQLMEVAELHLGLYGQEAFERAIKALKEVGISSPLERMDDYPHQMSGGMKQRVMIAMALIAEPDILIADEPTTALDVTIQAQVLDVIRELQKRKQMAVLLITHDMGVVAEMADDVIVMYASEAVEKGTVKQIFDNMTHPYTLGLFQSRPASQPGQSRLEAIKGSVPSIKDYPHGCKFHPRCPFVMDKCKHGEVPCFTVEHSHTTKCWLYERNTHE